MADIEMLSNFYPFKGMKKMYERNNYPYANCTYTSLLTIGSYFNKSILPILNNVIFIYRFNKEKIQSKGYFRLEVVNIKPTETLLDDIGILVNAKSPDIFNLKEEIIDSISRGCPLSICIDLFYQKGRIFYYDKQHGPHSLLVYGYDGIKDEVYTVDDIDEYKEYTVPFSEFENYCKVPAQYPDFKYYFEYSLKPDENNLQPRDLSNLYISDYINSMLEHKDEIIDSLKSINYMSDSYEYIIKNDDLIETLSSTIYRKCSDKYRLVTLFEYNLDVLNVSSELQNIMDNIIDGWMFLRALSAKAIYSQKFNSEVYNNCIHTLKNIYENEQEYNEILFSMLKAWKA